MTRLAELTPSLYTEKRGRRGLGLSDALMYWEYILGNLMTFVPSLDINFVKA